MGFAFGLPGWVRCARMHRMHCRRGHSPSAGMDGLRADVLDAWPEGATPRMEGVFGRMC